MNKRVNVGFRVAAAKLGRKRVCELLEITEDNFYKILRGDVVLKLCHACKLFDAGGAGWAHFREWDVCQKEATAND